MAIYSKWESERERGLGWEEGREEGNRRWMEWGKEGEMEGEMKDKGREGGREDYLTKIVRIYNPLLP